MKKSIFVTGLVFISLFITAFSSLATSIDSTASNNNQPVGNETGSSTFINVLDEALTNIDDVSIKELIAAEELIQDKLSQKLSETKSFGIGDRVYCIGLGWIITELTNTYNKYWKNWLPPESEIIALIEGFIALLQSKYDGKNCNEILSSDGYETIVKEATEGSIENTQQSVHK